MTNNTLVYGTCALAPRLETAGRTLEVIAGTAPQYVERPQKPSSDAVHPRASLCAPMKPAVARALFVASVLLVLACAIPLGAQAISARLGAAATPSVQVNVEPGDSLWSLAREHPIPGLSTNEVVSRIRELNDLDSSLLRPGEQLMVPQT